MTPLLDVDRVRVLLAGNTVGMLTMSPSRTLRSPTTRPG